MDTMRMTRLIAIGATLVLAGCKGTNAYVHPQADLSSVKTVAIMPFDNMTPERIAGDKVQRIFATELLHYAPFSIVEPGQVTRALRNERIETVSAMTPADMKKVGAALGAEGLFFGSLLAYSESKGQSTTSADVSLQLRLVEASSGIVLWSASQSRTGASFSQKMFGVGGETAEEAAEAVIRDELKTLLR